MNALSILLRHPDIDRLGWMLLHSLWQGVAVAALLAAALRMLRNGPSQARYIACCAAMLLLAALPVMTFFVPPVRSSPLAGNSVPLQMVPAISPAAAPDVSRSPRQVLLPPLEDRLRPVLPAVVAIWLAGVLGLSAYHAAGWLHIQGLRRSAHPLGESWQSRLRALAERLNLRSPILLAESALVQTPALLGWLRPIVLVPAIAISGLPPQQLEALLAHELAHIRRHDYLVNLIQIVIETLLFYHPATWWISRQIRQERENCCDDIATRICGDRLLYAHALTSMEELRSTMGELALGAGGGKLLPRIRRILAGPAAEPRPRAWSLAAAAIALASVLLPAAAVRLSAAEEITIAKGAWFGSATTTQPTTFPAPSPVLPEDLVVKVQDYIIGPNDLITVSLWDLVNNGVESVRTARVSETGMFSLPMLNKPIQAAGLTEAELQNAIVKAYKDATLIANARVSVTVVEARQRSFSIIGSIARPGQYVILQADFRLLNAIASAGGLVDKPEKLHIVRQAAVTGGAPRVIEIPLRQLLAPDLRYDVVIRPGDMIMVASPLSPTTRPTTQPSR